MTSKKGLKNARRLYTQQVLSGFEHINQPKITNGDSSQNEQRGEEKIPPEFWEQKSYQVSISVIIEKLSSSSDQHVYSISINDDADILISPFSKRSKKASKQAFTIHKPQVTKTRKIPMVYGIHQTTQYSLSYPPGYPTSTGVTELYSFLLGQLDRAIECTILQQENAPAYVDKGQRVQSPQSPENLGANKAKRRSTKVLPKIRNEALPEISPPLDETNGAILGSRPGNDDAGLVTVGDDPFIGTGLESVPLDF